MVYIDINRSITHADPPLGSRWALMWVHMWAQTLVILLVYVTKGNIYIPLLLWEALVSEKPPVYFAMTSYTPSCLV